MTKYLALVLCLFSGGLMHSYAQGDAEIKNIHKRLEKANDSIKIHLCRELYDGYFYSRLDKALEYAQKGYDLAVDQTDLSAVADFSNKIGSVYLLQAKYSSALIYLLKSVKISEELNDEKLLADAFHKIGLTYLDQENYPKALEYLFSHLRLVGNNTDKSSVSRIYNSIGIVYERQGIYNRAQDYYYKALKLNEEIDDLKAVASSYKNIGNINTVQHKYTLSFEYFFKSLEIVKELKDTVMTVSILNSIGNVYEKLNENYKALTYYFDALELVEKVKDKTGMAFCLHNIANTYARAGEIENALGYEMESFHIAKDLESKEYLRITSLGLSDIYSALGNYKKAFEYHKIHTTYKDAILTEKNSQQIAESKVNYEEEKREKEIELLKREQLLLKQRNEIQNLNLSKRTLLIYTLVLIIFLVFLLVIFLIGRIHLKKKINNQLEDKVKERTSSLELAINELYKTNNELDNFIYRSSHDLSGPLATISGLCNVAMLDVKDPTAQSYFLKLREVVNRMTNLLYLIIDIGNIKHHTLEKTTIILKPFLEEIIQSIGLNEKLENIHLTLEIQEGGKVETDSKMLEVVMYNIIKNAIQYSRPARLNHRPYILVSLKETSSFWEISVADNGYGIPSEFAEKIFDMFFKGTNVSTGFGLGLYKAKNAIEKLGGEISLYSLSSNHKTLFIISIPKNNRFLKPSSFFDFNFKSSKVKSSTAGKMKLETVK